MPDALAEVGKKYGGGTTYKSVWARMSQMKSNAELINNAFEAGIDPITVDLPEAPAQAAKRGSGTALLSCYHVTPSTITLHSRFPLSLLCLRTSLPRHSPSGLVTAKVDRMKALAQRIVLSFSNIMLMPYSSLPEDGI